MLRLMTWITLSFQTISWSPKGRGDLEYGFLAWAMRPPLYSVWI